jgi:carbonic anhydrase/acetyltransferase-like protein (isoleucine patch superfamily)
MLDRPDPPATRYHRARNRGRNLAGVVVRQGWELVQRYGSIGPTSAAAGRFGAFGDHSVVCFPYEAIVNEYAVSIGSHTVIGKGAVLSAGWGPGHPGLAPDVLRIGDRCLLGRGSSIVAHESIVLEDDVWTGQHVHITDMNHGYTRREVPISEQSAEPAPVHIGAGSWLGHDTVVLPGVRIGRHVVVGAGSVVTRDLPDFAVAVGAPARVVRRWDEELGWVDVDPDGVTLRPVTEGVAGLANRVRPLEGLDEAALRRLAEAVEVPDERRRADGGHLTIADPGPAAAAG